MSDRTMFSEGGEAATSQETQEADKLSEWVGEGKKYRTQEDALKSIPHAQEHIQSLEKTLEELRSDLAERESLSAMLEKLKAGEKTEDTTRVPQEDLATLVDQRLSEREKRNRVEQNLLQADKLWREQFGDKASDEYKSRLAELGLSNERAQEIAADSPTAFMRLMGVSESKAGNTGFRGTINTEANVSSNSVLEGSYEYWQKVRRENPAKYYSPKVQKLVQESIARLGEDKFFGRKR